MDPEFSLSPQPRSWLSLWSVRVALALVLALGIGYFVLLAAPSESGKEEAFVVPLDASSTAATIDALAAKGFIKNRLVFSIALNLHGALKIAPGGYTVSKSMNVWKLAGALSRAPSSRWVSIPEGLRKEEIADILQKDLGWTDAEKAHWITVDTVPDADHTEGVYFPDTYLIPTSDSPADVAARLTAHFNEVFAPYQKEATAQNVKWTTALKLASLIQREAAGTDDMALISGILWNRLEGDMPLGIDATVQYVKGSEGDWWPALHAGDTDIDSPFNTYRHIGLPPHPIDNPGKDAIEAALEPAKTDCLYYLHDSSGVIHCSKTFAGHQANIAKYLK